MGKFTDDKIIETMYMLVKTMKEVKRSDVMRRGITLNQINRIKTVFEEIHQYELFWDRFTKSWKWRDE